MQPVWRSRAPNVIGWAFVLAVAAAGEVGVRLPDGGTINAAGLPEPFNTLARERGARLVGYHVNAVCAEDCLITAWMARRDVDAGLVARYRNAIQAAAVWANQPRNRKASAAILVKDTEQRPALIARTPRSTFATRLRLRLAQPWIDAMAEFGVIPKAFPASELVR